MNSDETVWPVDDPESELIREVYARYGLAMFMAQVLEHAIVNMLLMLRFLPTRPDYTNAASWEGAFDDFCAGEFGKTFGNMLRTLESLELVPAVLLARLRQAKNVRDCLAHSFFRDNDLAFMTQQGRAQMIAFCDDAVGEFKAIDIEIDELCASQRDRYGITIEWLEQKFMEMQAQAIELSMVSPAAGGPIV
ncbi:MAG: hypothetical protein ABIU18_07605 [Novosphingobium sp.]